MVNRCRLGVVDVALAVVVPAEQFQIVEIGWSAPGPMPLVVRLTAAGWFVTAGGLAVPIPSDQGPELGVRCDATGAAEVEDFGLAEHDHAADVAVAGDHLQRRRGQVPVSAPFFARTGDELRADPRRLREV